MSITKRFLLYISIWVLVSVAVLIAVFAKALEVSPGINLAIDASVSKLSAHFHEMGYENSVLGDDLRRPDPLGNSPSVVNFTYKAKGQLEKVDCDSAYINTKSPSAIYADMEKTVQVMNDSLESEKETVMEAINTVCNGGSVHVSGKLKDGGWSIGSSTYNDDNGGKVRYVDFGAWVSY